MNAGQMKWCIRRISTESVPLLGIGDVGRAVVATLVDWNPRINFERKTRRWRLIPSVKMSSVSPLTTATPSRVNSWVKLSPSRHTGMANFQRITCLRPSLTMPYSIRILAEQTGPCRQTYDPHVKPEAPILQIVQIVLKSLGDRGIAAPSVDLGPTCDSNFQAMPGVVMQNLFQKLLYEIRTLRTGADYTHFALQHVKELR